MCGELPVPCEEWSSGSCALYGAPETLKVVLDGPGRPRLARRLWPCRDRGVQRGPAAGQEASRVLISDVADRTGLLVWAARLSSQR